MENTNVALWKIIIEVIAVVFLASYVILLILCINFYKLRKKAEKNSIIDALTGLYNRRGLSVRLDQEIKYALRYGRNLHAVYIDLDNFKQVNDTYGHEHGDYVLNVFSSNLKRIVRGYDILARIGGDEFALVMPETTTEATKKVAERIIQMAEKIEINDKPAGISASVGIKQYNKLEDSAAYLESSAAYLIGGADKAMYAAKNSGKGKVCTT